MKKLMALFLILLTSRLAAYTDGQVISYVLSHPYVTVLLEQVDIVQIDLEKKNIATSWNYVITFKTKMENNDSTLECIQEVLVSEIGGFNGSFMTHPEILVSKCSTNSSVKYPVEREVKTICGMGGPMMINDSTGECRQSLSTCETAGLKKIGFRSVDIDETICQE